jgi:predicted metal-dependent hydrolase
MALVPEAQMPLFDAHLGDRWTVRVSARARRLAVRVYPGGRVEVVAPRGVSAELVERFVQAHRAWIDERVRHSAQPTKDGEEPLPTSVVLAGIEREYRIAYLRSTGASLRLMARDSQLSVIGKSIEDPRLVAAVLRRWLTAVAERELTLSLRRLAAEHGFSFERVQIRRQRTRWGSCSSSGTISLNVCALFMEPAVLRYLLVHELCHTKHMDHSKRFWSLVAACEPNFRALDRQLTHGWQRVPAWVFA